MYIQLQKLKELVKEAQGGAVSQELIDVVYRIAEGLKAKYKYNVDLDDYKQTAILLVLTKIHRVDTSKNVFNYLTTCVRNAARQMIRSQVTFETHLTKYAERNRDKLGEAESRR